MSKPAAGFVKNKSVKQDDKKLFAQKSNFAEAKNAFGDVERKDLPTRRKNRLDPLTEKLGCSSYYHKMRWSWFVYPYGGINHPLEVSRFYPEKNLAIDIGLNKSQLELVEFKKNILETQDIKYVLMKDLGDLAGLQMGLE